MNHDRKLTISDTLFYVRKTIRINTFEELIKHAQMFQRGLLRASRQAQRSSQRADELRAKTLKRINDHK
jgi:hypothetical protein